MAAPNWANRTLFHGDNLDFLRAMNSESVDLIATDPPFNKGKDFHATPDSLAAGAKFQDRWSWEQDVHQEWVDQITDDFPKLMEAIKSSRFAHSDGMGAFMCFMAVRLLEMRRVLKPSGSIYLHCDPTASHYLKAIMDAIFGKKNFVNEIIWHYASGGRSKNHYPRKHDSLLYYAKDHRKRRFNGKAIMVPRNRCPSCNSELPKWNNLKKHVDKDGRVYRTIKSAGKTYKYYDDEPVLPPNVWLEFSHLQQKDPERTGYPTQKPIALYERIIKASSNEGDIVLDPFAGCATTCVAAERLRRQWVGIDIWDMASDVVVERLNKEGLFKPKRTKRSPKAQQGLLFAQCFHFTSEIPTRTDDAETASPFLRVKVRIKEPEGEKMSRAEMYEYLLSQRGAKCQGCDRMFDDPRYLELDHNTPRSDGGLNHISNRILLCSPCNRAKSNQYTLSGLRRLNKKNGWMAQ